MIDYKQLRAAVDAKLSTDPEFRTIMKRITEGRATFIDTARYSQVLSHILGSEVSKAILNVDDREAVVSHLLHDSYEDINDVFGRVQKDVDKSKGLDLKPQRGEYPGERVEQFVHSLVDPTVEDSVIKRRARAGTETITKSFHDDAIKVNAEFHEEAGLKCYIERIGVDCCQWCSDVAGKYEMKDQPQGIFRRHDNCDCTVIYDGQVLRGQVGNNGRRSKKWVEVPKDAGAAAPKRLTQEQAKQLNDSKVKINKTSIDNNNESAILNNKIRFYSINEEMDNIYTEEEIEAEMQKSPVGQYISNSIEHDGYSIEMNYDSNAPIDVCGINDGKTISVNVINHANATELVETIIHEVAHDKFAWSDTQEGEVNCRIYEYLHSHKNISEDKIKEIVDFVKEYYSYFPKGDLYGY